VGRAQGISSLGVTAKPTGVALAILVAVILVQTWINFAGFGNLPLLYFERQDRWLLMIQALLLILLCRRLPARAKALSPSGWMLPAATVSLVVLCYAGTKWILCDYQLSRDEQMAVFDARIFSSGRMVAPLPHFWQQHASALNLIFMPGGAHPIAWISSYLPMNALLRSGIGLIIDPAFTGPLFVAGGLICLWHCARLIWPKDKEAAFVACLLYIGSGQILFAGMTAYAMPAHLTLNLLWLWLFLLNRRLTDLGALLVAFVATGLHQLLFHPMFAAPLLVLLVKDRQWKRAALFAAGYALIGAFWLRWPAIVQPLVENSTQQAALAENPVGRLWAAATAADPERTVNMAANLLRFLAWQPILLFTLMIAALPVVRRNALAASLAASVVLPIIVMAWILSYQGHGFGYRYLHGTIGSCILLAVYGWQCLKQRTGMHAFLLRTTLATILIVLPIQAAMAHRFYATYARIDRAIRSSGAQYALVGAADAPFSRDLILNSPDLRPPVRLVSEATDDELLRAICRHGAHIVTPSGSTYQPVEQLFGLSTSGMADARIRSSTRRLKAAGCRLTPPVLR